MAAIDWILRGIGLAVLAVLAWELADIFWRGFRLSASLHVTMWRGMRMSGRRPRWLRLPQSFFSHAWSLGTSGDTSITGNGYHWTTNGERSVWDARTRLAPARGRHEHQWNPLPELDRAVEALGGREDE